ncbi:High cysteine membrane protein [Giardia muris]|uniref:High cysteine membrane protein n=1 Tax=Giardia muris TaxID=5742 RepID=A0A4Z1T478_GIAMU|nr:High cysteine membrane protein [Giardia muris]|eukprot:TNJ27221.1 High cysteine membrane protein [Giardia muris]
MLLLLLLVGIFCAGCDFTVSSVPAGECGGPMGRSQARRVTAALPLTNAGCAIDQIPFHPDGQSTEVRCGQCDPQQTTASGTNPNCPISHVCTDEGVCTAAKNYALFGLPCPGGGALAWCGSLPCINRRCVQCFHGTSVGPYTCIDGQYYDGPMARLAVDPATIISLSMLGGIVGIIVIYMVVSCIQGRRLRRRFYQGLATKLAAPQSGSPPL